MKPKKHKKPAYYDNKSILVSTPKSIIRLYCPFKVECIKSVDAYNIGDKVTVVSVMISEDKKLVYVIREKKYHYYFFHVLINR